ncbi:MAG: bifunctional diaminohydroxyphosphoribosylaminopyrimidine deaminase/5-amino-6-(5-phosphoribosylamino)uracil reductase RibD [Proteobacteria bacterium]|nr:bifunctional diaminohydroxyphosphoribosylaminopyrimidine deaminase/5-amino-6-(5-phosphoribosylamino)uracil reductase RibD [Pseudomonadota bacterium]MBU1389283.1 bifunctional diaminohydroxyphosphoribosylaminopyrimidine deaminase/5-amino-6-(5-phosphoribosylamino)uracil reductase RibD [Pseudomonadota bacterium]MBU1544103.1 bifunctional diaminohydroxyphosphoribosylaminopyrimidine deaminase/5-amino-6-(5-phosphoribosylamino)uracil reductase RibD [Pseudomonadota bacterium]MBU2431379.1 bifunctional d
MTDHEYMQLAVSCAKKAKGFTSPNPCVGAVVVKNDIVVGTGFHRAAGLPHAEVEAIEDAGVNARGATIYVTLEPCNHFGKTPPCTHKILDAGIRKVVVGCKDPNPFVSGGGIQYLQDKGVQVVSGVLEQQTRTLIEDFIWYVQNNQTPFVILKCASTLDGQTATSTGDSKWITNAESREYVHQIRHETDAILVGSGTLHSDNPSLTARIEGQKTKDPVRIILDTHLTIKKDAKVLTQKSDAKTIIVTGPGISKEKIKAFETDRVQVMAVSLKGQRLDLNELMIKLGKISILSVLIEGGSTLAGVALRSGIVNKMMFFMAPKFLGGSDGYPVFAGTGPKLIKDAFVLKNMDVRQFGSDILVQGYLK